MAGNFWQSSHYQQWLLDKQELIRERQHDLAILTEEEYQKVFIFFANFIQTLGENLKIRQQVIATATVYFKRFYSKNSLKCVDPLLLAPTCVFLALKVEEFGVMSNSRIVNTVTNLVKKDFAHAFQNINMNDFPVKNNSILECEFFLLENLDCCLIVYQPYRPLLQMMQDVPNHDDQLLSLAWKLINDSLRTDVSLLYPPYMIALGCLQIACVLQSKEKDMNCMKTWFAELNVDLEKVQEITKYLVKLYDLWSSYDEKKDIPALIKKIPKPNVQPMRQV